MAQPDAVVIYMLVVVLLPLGGTLLLQRLPLRPLRWLAWGVLAMWWAGHRLASWLGDRCRGELIEVYYQCEGISDTRAMTLSDPALAAILLAPLVWVLLGLVAWLGHVLRAF